MGMGEIHWREEGDLKFILIEYRYKDFIVTRFIGKHRYTKKHKHTSASYVFVCLSTKSVQGKKLPGHF